jgi:hypothetical protein
LQQIVLTDIIVALKAMSTDCEETLKNMLLLFANSPNIYLCLNVEQEMQGLDLSEWEKLPNVDAHTMHYLREKEVLEKLALVVNAIQFPKAQLMMEQLGMAFSFKSKIKLPYFISLSYSSSASSNWPFESAQIVSTASAIFYRKKGNSLSDVPIL